MVNIRPESESPPAAAEILMALLMYAKHPATPNSPRWVSFMVPEDFIEAAEDAIAGAA